MKDMDEMKRVKKTIKKCEPEHKGSGEWGAQWYQL